MIIPARLRSQRACTRFEVTVPLSPLHRFVSFDDVKALLLALKARDLPVARALTARLRRGARKNEILADWLRDLHIEAPALARLHLARHRRESATAGPTRWEDVPAVDDGEVVEGQIFEGCGLALDWCAS